MSRMKSANLKSSFNSQNNNLYIMTMSDSSYSKFDYNNLSTKENDELSQYLRISSAPNLSRRSRRSRFIVAMDAPVSFAKSCTLG